MTPEQEHNQKYGALCLRFGVRWSEDSPKLVGETLESLRRKHREDHHLNNVPLRRWDSLAEAFKRHNPHARLSLAERVCMQKWAARALLERTAVWVLSRDDEEIMRGTQAECYRRLHELCPTSWSHALQHEGYSVEEDRK